MKKIKPLIPTLKEKKRYVAFRTISDSSIESQRVYERIKESYARLFGSFGLGAAGLMFMKAKSGQDVGIVRVDTSCVDRLKASLAFITDIDGKDAIVDCVGVSGIVKKAHSRYVVKRMED